MAARNTVFHGHVIIGGIGRKKEAAADQFALLAIEASRGIPYLGGTLNSKDHSEIIKGLLLTYFKNGGQQAMITVLNRDDLMKAMKEPEKYGHIMVRVGGFSARFVTLAPDVQKEIASRTLY